MMMSCRCCSKPSWVRCRLMGSERGNLPLIRRNWNFDPQKRTSQNSTWWTEGIRRGSLKHSINCVGWFEEVWMFFFYICKIDSVRGENYSYSYRCVACTRKVIRRNSYFNIWKERKLDSELVKSAWLWIWGYNEFQQSQFSKWRSAPSAWVSSTICITFDHAEISILGKR